MRLCSPSMREAILKGQEPDWLTRHPRRQYLIQLFASTPPWVDRKALHRLTKEARRKSRRSEHRRLIWVVDHIVPITHAHVCGLTVPWNMRIIRSSENAARSNRWWQWTEDLFSEPEQLRLL